MPRRSTRAQPSEVPEGERRVTRRSLQAAATPDKPERASPRAATEGKTKQPSPSPASRGRGRGRGRSSGGRAKIGKSEEEEEDEESEEKPEETAVDETESNEDKTSETGSGDTVEKKPARGRGRGRGKSAASKKKSAVEKEEEKTEEPNDEPTEESKEENVVKPKESEETKEEEKLSEAKEETVTPKKGRGRRSAGSSPAKAETPPSSGRSSRTRSPRKLPEETPTRRSGRTRKSASKEETATPTKDAEEMETEEPTGQKRKREDDDTEISEKKQKTEEAETEVPQKEESMEVEEPKVDTPQESEDMPDKPEEDMKPEEIKKAEETEERENNEDTKVAETKEPETSTTETKEPEASAIETKEPETSTTETKEPEASAIETKEPEAPADTPSASDEKEEAAKYPSADEPENPTVTQPEEPKPMDTTPDTEENEKTVEKAAETPIEKESEPDMNEYVLVNKEEVPPADSEEVADALPKEPEPTKEAEVADKEVEKAADHSATPESNMNESEPTSQPVSVIQEPVPSQPEPPTTTAAVDSSERPTENGEDDSKCGPNASTDSSDVPGQEPSKDMAAPSNNIDSVAQEPSATIPNPLFQRQFVANPNINSTLAADVARKFSVVSYNILADCHAPMNKYPWITPDHLSQEYRNKKLLQELQYLDADILCLQEVGSQYYENTLKPTLGALGYEGSYMKRVDDHIDEGEATFVRSNRFTVVSQKGIALRDLAFKELGNSGLENGNLAAVKQFVDKPSVILVTQVRCNNTGNTVTVGNIHVSWEQLSKPDLQCIEVAGAIKELVATATPQGAFFICGDFNSWPGSPVYQLTKEGYLSDQSVSELQGVNNVRMEDQSLSPLINLWWKGFQHTANNMKSAYHHVLGNEPHTTRYPHNGWVKQVDFVWYSGNTLDTCGVLEVVQQEQLDSGIPNAFFPSDHISLKTDLVFKH